MLLELADDDLRQVALFHIGKRGIVDHIERHAAAQPRQKRQARFGGAGAKRREVIGADLRGVAIRAGMARPRIVDRDIGAAQTAFSTASSSARNVSSLAVSNRTTCRFEITTPMPLRSATIRSQVSGEVK